MIGKYNPSVILTYLGVASAILGMSLALSGNTDGAMMALILSGLADLFDGRLADFFQRSQEEKAFGVQIDSLADVISFLALPAVIALTLNQGWLSLIAVIFYILAGIIRLAYFNLAGLSESRGKMTYRGLPVTFAAMIFPLAWLFLTGLWPSGQWAWPFLNLVMAGAFVMDFPVPKPKGKGSLVLLALAIACLIIYGVRG